MSSQSTRTERHSVARQQVSAALAECLAASRDAAGDAAAGRRRDARRYREA